MFFRIDPHNGVAIYDQIVRQVKFAVARGVIQTGELVPSVRELSRQIAVNPNTVARAYRDLQNDGVLAGVRGTGLEVTPEAARLCEAERSELIRQRLESVLREALQSGLAPPVIRQMVNHSLQTLSQEPGEEL